MMGHLDFDGDNCNIGGNSLEYKYHLSLDINNVQDMFKDGHDSINNISKFGWVDNPLFKQIKQKLKYYNRCKRRKI